MSYLKDREIWLSNVPTGNPPAGYFWKFIQNGKVVVRDSSGNNQIMVATSGSQAITGSLTVTEGITGTATTASYVEYSNVANKPALVSGSSQVEYSGLTGIPSGIVSGSAQIASFGIFATTGSNGFNGNQSITGSLTVTGQVVAQTLNVQQVTSSIVYSSGSNIFGNDLGNTQQFTGSVSVTGSLSVNGTSAVVGSGTQNYISKFSAGNAIGNSLIFDNGTNVGIGTATPTAGRLQINVNDTTTVAHFQVADGTTTLANSFVTNFRNANDGNGRYSLSSWQVQNAVGNDQNGFIGVQSVTGGGNYTPNIVFGQKTGVSSYTTRMTLDSSGNLGLGVTPSAWYTGYTALQVGESAALFSNRTSADTRTTQLANNAFLNSNASAWVYAQSDEATRYGQVSGEHQWFNAPSGTAGNAISFTQAMTLDANGRLALGGTTVTDNTLLNIQGSSATHNVGIILNKTNATAQVYGIINQGPLDIYNYTSSTYMLRITTTGRLLLGTTDDNGARLQVSGTARITGSTNEQLVLDYATASGGFTWQSFRLNGTSRYRIFGNTDNSFTLWSDILSSNVLSISSTGAATFSSTVTATQYTATSTGGSGLRVYGASGTNQWDMYLNGANIRFSDNTGGGRFVVDNIATFSGTTVAANGSVNIESADPAIRFRYTGGTTNARIYEWRAVAAGGVNDIMQLRLWNDAQSSATTLFTVSPTGAGVFSSTVTATRGFFSSNAASDSTTGLLANATTNDSSTYAAIFGSLNAGYRMVVRADGNVGIGINSPTTKLQVVGDSKFGSSTNFVTTFADSGGVYFENTGTSTATRTLRLQGLNDAGNAYTQFFISHGAGNIRALINDQERIRIDGDGLKFNGDTAAANALDDYEEGTWAPTFQSLSLNVGANYSDRVGSYTKIGNMVYAFFDMTATSITGTLSSAIITGLPFTVSSNLAGYSVGQYRDATAIQAGPDNTNLKGFAERGQAFIYLQLDNLGVAGFGTNSTPATWKSTGGRITGYVIYQV